MSTDQKQQPANATIKSVKELKKRVVAASIGKTSLSSIGPSSLLNRGYVTQNTSSPLKVVKRKTIWDFNSFELNPLTPLNCVALPFRNQERLIIAELIYCLIGMRGTFITLQPQDESHIADTTNLLKPLKFIVSEQVNASLRHMVMEILPLASHYSLVEQFVKMHDNIYCSQVLQALGSALRTQLNDYVLGLVQLETEMHKRSLSIQDLQYYLQSIMTTMRILAEIVTTIVRENMCGARVLSLLHGKIVSYLGDQDSQALLVHLTEMAAVPYFKVLQLWILKGVICDPRQEFMIADNEIIRREEIETNQYSASYWEKRYAIRREGVPRFLEKVSEIILRTGKYLNVIRQCGNTMPVCTETLCFDATNENHTEFIKTAYRNASRKLLELLVQDKDLMGHLTSVKRYLLMHQGDFINEFMDACDEELSKNINDVLPMKLDNLLGLTLRTSSAKHDRYKDNLVCNLFTTDVVKMMAQIHLVGNARDESTTSSLESFSDLTGFDCFAFRYEIQWPVSLIMNNMVETQYQMLFRLLFCCKHVERQLYKVWYDSGHKSIIKFETQSSSSLRVVFLLRQRMMNAIHNVEYYMMVEVIEPMWHLFLQKMDHVENVDDVLVAHHDFIDKCLENCMLKAPDALSIIINICKVCSDFCTVTKSGLKLKPSVEYLAHVKRFDDEFTELLMRLLNCINVLASENPSGKFINLVHRINFNGFYTNP